MKVGNNKIGSLVLAALSSSEQQPAPSADTPQKAAGEAALPGTGPIFGQAASAGVINVIRPASEESVKGGLLTSVATSQSYADGSSAQRLFVRDDARGPARTVRRFQLASDQRGRVDSPENSSAARPPDGLRGWPRRPATGHGAYRRGKHIVETGAIVLHVGITLPRASSLRSRF
jgi:hypothetical protein